MSQAYQALGYTRKSLSRLDQALALARQSGDRLQVAEMLGALGNLYLATGELEPASQYLHDGLKAAQDLDYIALAAHLLNNLGNLSSAQDAYEEALDYYRGSLPLAIQAETPMVARALINAAQAALHLDQEAQAKSHLEQARQQLRGLPASHDKAESLLSLGQTYNTLRSHLPEARQVLLVQAAEVFNEAAQVATTSGDVRLLSYAWGYLGQLYEVDRRYGEALQLTRRAALAAQRVRAPESSYRWQWQTGRLLRVMGDLAAAVEAYRHAADTLQTFRTEIGPVYGGRGARSGRWQSGCIWTWSMCCCNERPG